MALKDFEHELLLLVRFICAIFLFELSAWFFGGNLWTQMPKALGTSGAVIYFPEGLITFFASPLGIIDTVKKM